MGCVAVLNPQDLLKASFGYNRMPLLSPSTNPLKDSLKSKDANPNLIHSSNENSKTVSNSNRRKRSPQKKNDSPRLSSPKNTHAPNLVMGKVTILKRGQALDNDEVTEKKIEKKKILLLDKENMSEVFDKEKKNEKKLVKDKRSPKKTELVDKESKNEKKKVGLFEKEKMEEKKDLLFDKKVEKEIEVSKEIEEKKRVEDSESIQTLLMRYGPDPALLPRFYAGSAFIDSPSPRSVPLPSFLGAKTNYEFASNTLRRLLKLGVGI